MKSNLIILLLLLTVFSCKKEDQINVDNPYLIDPLVSMTLNLNLPEYNPLKFPGNSIIINQQGIKGIVIYNVNNDLYTAFELSDPNHTPNECSRMTIEGIIATCPCESDTHSYDIVTGRHQTNENLYPMLQYLAIRTGDNINVSN
jgi:hypothetical protein